MDLLIEQVDFQSVENLIITESTEGDAPVKKYYLTGPHAEGGIKNHNGRTYPVPVIARQVDRLNESDIPQNRMLGELGHPDCHTSSAKIRTEDGWKFIKDISDTEKVYTLNINTNEIELHTITRKIDEQYKGKMFRIKLRNLDTMVTPNHRFLTVSRYGEYEYVTAEELFTNPTKYSHSYIPNTGNWNTNTDDMFGLDGIVGIYLDKRFIQIEEITDFDDRVYCVSVPNQNFYCMDNGKSFWSGNSIEIHYDRVSHLTKELRMENNIAWGKSLVLDTPMGKIVKSLMEANVKVCTSTRGIGTLKDTIVQNDYNWKCNDLVHDPSAPSAILSSICENRMDWVIEDGILSEKEYHETIQEVNKVIVEHQFSKEDRQAAFIKLFAATLNKIKRKHI